MGALSFTSPLMLAALGALPVIWLLLRATPPAPKRQRFPAFIILRQLTTAEETPDRTPWWLLLLRLLLAALVIVALAGPILNAPTPTQQTGPMVLVVDDSWAAAQNWRARRASLREAAAEAAQNDRQVFLLTTAPRTVPAPVEPITGEALDTAAQALAPSPFASDRASATARLEALDPYLTNQLAEIRWYTDGVASEADADFAAALSQRGTLSAFVDRTAPKIILRRPDITQSQQQSNTNDIAFRIDQLSTGAPYNGALIATARDGRELARTDFSMAQGERSAEAAINLPLALANELSTLRVANVPSAGAVYLADARDRQALIGLVADATRGRSNLLSGGHYVKQALGPLASFVEDNLTAIIASDASVIILNDVGRLRAREVESLSAWVERGGVLVRFAGPVLAEAAQSATPDLSPVELRGGGRAFGGALTWDTPQRLDVFAEDSPFAGLDAPPDVLIRRQVLAQPGGDTTEKTWARLEDGTPLVTGARKGDGAIALFHVTATPDWSDLPISGLFVDMLRRLTFLSALGPDNVEDGADKRYAPLRLLNGEGRLVRPGDKTPALTAADLAAAAAPTRAPGFYGAPEAPLAMNAVTKDTIFEPLSINGVTTLPYEATPPRPLSPPLIIAALVLLLIDGLLALKMSGRLSLRSVTAALAVAIATPAIMASPADAQPLDPPIGATATDAALATRLAYVETGEPAIDALSDQGLTALSRELNRRTAIEPAPPTAINLDTDDLSVYSFLYWPMAPGAEQPSDDALANIENFMRFGGLLVLDTRDDERAITAGSTPESASLQRILSQMDVPPLTPVDNTHVLTRSFYLLEGLTGRMNNNPVWVEADSSGSNDGVTSLIIGGRDWAGAWAADRFGRPVRPIGPGGPRIRELSYRAGVNMVMVAFTGNYKSDQVHTPILLERLGQ